MKSKGLASMFFCAVLILSFANCANQVRTTSRSGLKRIHFDTDQSLIRSDMIAILNTNVSYLKKYSSKAIVIEGHCDERGTNEYNMALGARRAQAVMQYMVSRGIKSSRLTTKSYGEERPMVQGSDESAWYMNRRAEFIRAR